MIPIGIDSCGQRQPTEIAFAFETPVLCYVIREQAKMVEATIVQLLCSLSRPCGGSNNELF